MWTGAVYRLAAATQGMPVCIPVIGFVWIQPVAALDDDNPWFGDPELTGVGDDEFDVGDVVGDVLFDENKCDYEREKHKKNIHRHPPDFNLSIWKQSPARR